eukprot:COSAG02_NODE_2062_length_9971_cov_5.016106_1_plen_283_part_00
MDSTTHRTFLDYHTGLKHTVHKSKQRLARCRFIMIYSDPARAPLPSKGLRLARISGLDQPDQPVYGLTDDSWKLEIACQQCHALILNHDRVGGPVRLRAARRRRAAKSNERAERLLCSACDSDTMVPLTSSCQRGKRGRESPPTLPAASPAAWVSTSRVGRAPDASPSSVMHRLPQDAESCALADKGIELHGYGYASSDIERGLKRTADVSTSELCSSANSTAAVTATVPTNATTGTGISTPPAHQKSDQKCPFCINTCQQGQRLGTYWRKFGYQGAFCVRV